MVNLKKYKTKYMKSEIENYYFMIKLAYSKLATIENIQTEYYEDVMTAEECKQLEEEIKRQHHEFNMLIVRIDKVDRFINRLEEQDQVIVYDLHMSPDKQETYENYCFEVGMAKMTLYRYVNKLILDHWES